jgi:hypothetical protein
LLLRIQAFNLALQKLSEMTRAAQYTLMLLLLLSIACRNGKEGETTTTTADTTQATGNISPATEEKYDYVISNIPIPFDILDRLFKSGVVYRKEFINPVTNEAKYLQNNSKALNLGIYGADLTYTICFEQFSELGPYLKCAKKLADDLGIPLAFNKETLDRYQDYRENKDSLRGAVYRSYHEVDKTLRSNERISQAALVVTGGWIEGLYIAASTASKNDLTPEARKELLRIVRKQSFHLDNIINLLNEFKSEPYFQQLISELQQIQQVYASAKSKKEVSEEESAAILAKVSAFRAKIVMGQ